MIDLTQSKFSENKFVKFIKSHTGFLKDKSSLFYYVILLIFISICFYFLMLVNNNFTTPYSGDFVMQYIPFAYDYYDNWWSFFTTGVFPHWDSNIFLGADAITSDGYYILFSPFFALILIFPRDWIPQTMALVSILRMVLAGVFFRLFLRKLNISELLSRFGGIAFMACGWVAYFQWFNNFLDIAVFLPLILLGIEKVLQDKRPWLLAISLGYLGIDNFFFFPAICIMTFVYAMVRYFQRLKLNAVKSNLLILLMGFLGYVCAICISLVVFIPGLITGMSDPKIEGTTYLTQLVEYYQAGDFSALLAHLFVWSETADWKLQTYPIIEFFIFPTTCRHISLVSASSGNTFVNEAGSLWCGIPITFFLFPAIINSIRKGKISHIISICIFVLVLFTPFSYYLLFGGGKAYARWQIMFQACLIPYVLSYLDEKKNKIKMSDLLLGLGFTITGIIASILLAKWYVDSSTNLEYYLLYPWACIGLIAYVLVFFFVLLYFYEKEKFHNILLYFACFETALVGNFVTIGHSYTNPSSGNGGSALNSYVYDASSNISDYDSSFYRVYSSLAAQNLSDNNQNMNNYNGTAMFNTLYNFYTREFKWWARMSDWYGSWSASYVEKRQALDYFLNIKYYMVTKENTIAVKISGLSDEEIIDQINVPFGYIYNEDLSNDQVYVFENPNVNNIAFSYDTIYVYDDDYASSALSGSSSYALRNDDMYLLEGIVSQSTWDSIDDEYKTDLTTVSSAFNVDRSDATYHRVTVYDSRNTTNIYGTRYALKYYAVDDDWDYDASNLKDIIENETPLTTTEINDSDLDAYNFYITLTRENFSGSYDTKPQFGSDDLLAFDYFDEGSALYLYAPFTSGYEVDVYLLNKDGEIITYDNHRDDYVSNSVKSMRAFYADEEIYSVVLHPRSTNRTSFSFYLESKADYDSKIETVVGIQGEYINSNYFKFSTNYDSYRMISLNTPYEKGWKVYATKDGVTTQLDTFVGQGGFISFIGLTGDVTYEVKYKNADMEIVEPITKIAVFLWCSSLAAYIIVVYYLQEKRLNKELRLDL